MACFEQWLEVTVDSSCLDFQKCFRVLVWEPAFSTCKRLAPREPADPSNIDSHRADLNGTHNLKPSPAELTPGPTYHV